MPDYQNSLVNRMIHLQAADPRTRLGLQGCGGPIVLLLKDLGFWQQILVDREQRKPEFAIQQHGLIDVVKEVSMDPETTPAGKLRQLRHKETTTHPETPLLRALTLGAPQLNLCPGEVRVYVTQESQDGIIHGWVEAKRTAEEMEDSNMVAARDAMRKGKAREVTYTQAGGRSDTPEDEEMIVELSPEPVGAVQNSLEEPDYTDNSGSEEE